MFYKYIFKEKFSSNTSRRVLTEEIEMIYLQFLECYGLNEFSFLLFMKKRIK